MSSESTSQIGDIEGFHDESDNEQSIYSDYLKFIKVTRKHQAQREKLKKEDLKKKKPELEAWYEDISQLNTLVEDNLVDVPDKNDKPPVDAKRREENLIRLYGSQEAYERIRSMEMNIDEHFRQKYLELSPQYWPVIPFNPKPYLDRNL